MVALQHLLEEQDIHFHALENRIMYVDQALSYFHRSNSILVRCFPHIINICCQHIVSQFTDVELVDSVDLYEGMEPHGNPDNQSFEEAIKRDPIALGRAVV